MKEIVAINQRRFPGLRGTSKFRKGTEVLLPLEVTSQNEVANGGSNAKDGQEAKDASPVDAPRDIASAEEPPLSGTLSSGELRVPDEGDETPSGVGCAASMSPTSQDLHDTFDATPPYDAEEDLEVTNHDAEPNITSSGELVVPAEDAHEVVEKEAAAAPDAGEAAAP